MSSDNCPYCGTSLDPRAEVCPECDLPLAGEQELTRSNGRDRAGTLIYAGPVDPQLSTGRLRVVAVAANQVEAEMVEGLLRSEGIPCIVRRSNGADVPDFLAAGRRDILVPENGLDAARELLQIEETLAPADGPAPLVLAAGIAGGLIFMIGCAAALFALT